MNWFDLIIIILLVAAFIKGYSKGLIMQLVGLAAIIIAAIFGGKLAAIILPELNNLLDISPNFARVLSFIIAFSLIAFVILLIGGVIQRFIDVIMLGIINRLLGAVIGVGTIMVFLSIILNLILMLDTNESIINERIKEESFFFSRVEAVVPAIVPYLNEDFWNEYIPENYRKEIESKSDSVFHTLPENIDSLFQQKHFNVD